MREAARVFGEVFRRGRVHHPPGHVLGPSRVGHERETRARRGTLHFHEQGQDLRGTGGAVDADQVGARAREIQRGVVASLGGEAGGGVAVAEAT